MSDHIFDKMAAAEARDRLSAEELPPEEFRVPRRIVVRELPGLVTSDAPICNCYDDGVMPVRGSNCVNGCGGATGYPGGVFPRSSEARDRRKCPITCTCLCHDTGGGVHDHYGRPCPGKRPRTMAGRERSSIARGLSPVAGCCGGTRRHAQTCTEPEPACEESADTADEERSGATGTATRGAGSGASPLAPSTSGRVPTAGDVPVASFADDRSETDPLAQFAPLTHAQDYARGFLSAYGPLKADDPDSIGTLAGLIEHFRHQCDRRPTATAPTRENHWCAYPEFVDKATRFLLDCWKSPGSAPLNDVHRLANLLLAESRRERDQANPYSLLQTQAFIRERDEALAKKRAGTKRASEKILKLRAALDHIERLHQFADSPEDFIHEAQRIAREALDSSSDPKGEP